MKKLTPLLDSFASDQIITIGNKPDFIKNEKGEEIRTEPYLRPILDRLIKYNKIGLRVSPFPERLARVEEIKERLKYFGVIETGNRKRIIQPHKTRPNEKFEFFFIIWEVHPKLQVYREIEIYKNMKE